MRKILAPMWIGGAVAFIAVLTIIFGVHAQTFVPNGPPNSTIGCAYNSSPPTLSTGTAGQVQCDSKGNLIIDSGGSGSTGSYFNNVVGSTLTRASNTTPYTGNQAVCLLTSVTVCAPSTAAIAAVNAGSGLLTKVSLLKSGTSTTNATFTIWMFSAAPTTTSLFDASAYVGPYAADIPNYIGSAACSSPLATNDGTAQVRYDCQLSNPNVGGATNFLALSGSQNIDYLISATAAYTPASAETFKAFFSGIY